jgi:CelD/BcsL family acetyltransferase involved in cellulose biosynthesis
MCEVDHNFDVTLVGGARLTPAHRERIAELRASDASLLSPYFAAEFIDLVASLRDDVRVGIASRAGQIIGFFPFQAREDGTGEPLAHPHSDFHGVVATPQAGLAPERLLRGCELRSWTFHHLLARQLAFQPYHTATFRSPYLDLSGGFEAYVQHRRAAGSRQIRQIQRSHRKLEAEQGEVRFVARTSDQALLAQLRVWKEDRLRRRGINKRFSPWLWSLLQALSRTETDHFAGVLSALFAGSDLVAAHIGMRSPTVWHYWFPAFDPRFARYQPGLVLLLEMAQHAGGLGITRIDLGGGDEPYKARMSNGYELLARGHLEVGES